MRLGKTGLSFIAALFGLLGQAAAAEENAEASTAQLGQDLKNVFAQTVEDKKEEVVHQVEDMAKNMISGGSSDTQGAQGTQGAQAEEGAPDAGFSE